MAHDQRPDLRRERLTALAAVAVLASATAMAFARVFAGQTTELRLIVTALAAVAVASAFERRGLALATAAAGVALALLATWLVFPETARLLLPSGETLRATLDALGKVGPQAREQVSPATPIASLLLAALTAVFAASFSMHALAVRAGSPLLALIPSGALIGFADSALDGEGSVGFALLFLVGVLAVLAADGLRRVRLWGAIRPWTGFGGRRRAVLPRGTGGVALATLAAALLLPGALPGFGAGALIDLASGPEDATSIDPLVSIQASLTRDDTEELFRVDAQRPAYWRMLALDRFDGTTWSAQDLQGTNAPRRISGSELDTSIAEATAPLMQQRFTVETDLGFRWLPSAFVPTKITLDSTPAFGFQPTLGTATAPDPLREGQQYTVTSRLLSPSPRELDQVTAEDFATMRLNAVYSQLPPDTPPVIHQLAEQWSAGAGSPYRQVLAIQDQLRTFTYDLDVQPREDTNALVTFLTRSKRGFCQQFAASMAVLVRALGLPARVAVGFTPGEQNEDGSFSVTNQNAHSWVEVLFPGYGWLAFEPTPKRDNPTANRYLTPPPARCVAGSQSCAGTTATGKGTIARDGLPGKLGDLERRRGPGIGGLGARGRRGVATSPRTAPVPLGPVLLVVLALTLVALIAIPPFKLFRRRLHLVRAHGPRASVLAHYDVFTARAADLGLPRSPGETIGQYAERIRATTAATNGDLDRLTLLATAAAYGPDEPNRSDARDAAQAARRTLADLRRATGPVRRIAGIYRPGL